MQGTEWFRLVGQLSNSKPAGPGLLHSLQSAIKTR